MDRHGRRKRAATVKARFKKKNKTSSRQNRTRLIDRENRLMVARGEGLWKLGEKGEGVEKYRMVVTEWPWRCQVQHREYSQ